MNKIRRFIDWWNYDPDMGKLHSDSLGTYGECTILLIFITAVFMSVPVMLLIDFLSN